MSESNMDYEKEREEMAEVAMQMILHAGDARNRVMQALEHIGDNAYEQAQKELIEAKEELRQAHVHQTAVVQSEAAGKRYQYSLLLSHAQDTVMTIFSEYNLANKMLSLYQKLDGRISRLEQKTEE